MSKSSLQSALKRFAGADRAEDLDFTGVDAGIAMAHVQLAAGELGLPGRWSFASDQDGLRQRFSLPADARPVAVFEYGGS